jgi:hypothetical protein
MCSISQTCSIIVYDFNLIGAHVFAWHMKHTHSHLEQMTCGDLPTNLHPPQRIHPSLKLWHKDHFVHLNYPLINVIYGASELTGWKCMKTLSTCKIIKLLYVTLIFEVHGLSVRRVRQDMVSRASGMWRPPHQSTNSPTHLGCVNQARR